MKLKITIISVDVITETDGLEPLALCVTRAIAESRQVNNDWGINWEVRDDRGTLLDCRRSTADYGLKDGSRLFVCARVGFGG